MNKYKYDTIFFNKIDNERKAYILGLMYADGNNFSSYKKKVSLVLHSKDRKLLDEVNRILGSERPIQESRNTCVLHINGRAISEQLTSLGCMPRKSLILEYPLEEQVPMELSSHFIRGYFDGDGCISFGRKYKSASMVGTNKFLSKIVSILKDIGIKATLSRRENISELRITSKLGIREFHDYIYKNSSIYLDRKNSKFLELFKTY